MADGTDEVAEVTTHPQTPLRTNRPLIQAQLTVRHTRPAYIQDQLTYKTCSHIRPSAPIVLAVLDSTCSAFLTNLRSATQHLEQLAVSNPMEF